MAIPTYIHFYVRIDLFTRKSKLNQSAVAAVNWQFPAIIGELETDDDSSVSRLEFTPLN